MLYFLSLLNLPYAVLCMADVSDVFHHSLQDLSFMLASGIVWHNPFSYCISVPKLLMNLES